ncbi:putative E3 SUMO-protein ligase RNF212 isoform X3 [Arapaima gigas]
MATWICCSSCFHPPTANFGLAVTSCGHMVCSTCFRKGKEGECLICKSKCQVRPLSDKSSSEVKALFSDISSVATKYFSEISKVLIFQMRHRKRLLLHYQKKNEKLEELIYDMKQDMQIMNKKMVEQKAYIAKLEYALRHQSTRIAPKPSIPAASFYPLTTSSSVQNISYTSPLTLSRRPSSQCFHISGHQESTSTRWHIPSAYPDVFKSALSTQLNRTEPMDVDAQSQVRKPEMSKIVSSLSLMSPTQEAPKGAMSCRTSSHSTLTPGPFSAYSTSASREKLSSPAPSYWRQAPWEPPTFNSSVPFPHSNVSSQQSCPLSLTGFLPKHD